MGKSFFVAVLLVTSLAVVFQSPPAFAQVDSQTQDLLIEKLTRVYLSLPNADSSRSAIVLRLADLHSERARRANLKELNEGCVQCEAGTADRKKAIRYYEETLPKLSLDSQAKVLIQLGHLYQMTDAEAKAISSYEKVIAGNASPAIVSEAQLSLGETYFKKGEFAQANVHYKEVIKLGGSKGLAAYRSAWCEFNQGHIDAATQMLTLMLKNPEFLSRSSSAQMVSIDKQFQEEVSRDLATFLAKSESAKDVSELYELSPDSTRLDNVFYLASELERLGRSAASVEAWKFLLQKENRPAKKLAIHIHLAQNNLEAKNNDLAVQDYETALALWQTIHCEQDAECAELKTRLRKFVTDYHKMEKKAPTEALYGTYQRYLEVFPQEADMRLWSGEVAKELKKYQEATVAFSAAAKLALADKKNDLAETALLAAIEAAELSQDVALQTQMADQYLTLSVEKKKTFEVQYQKAHTLYEKNNYAAASIALKELALSPKGSADIKKKSADLALDSLALLKDNKSIETWSLEFAEAFPASAAEFSTLSRQAVLKQSAEATDTAVAWATLAKYNVNSATTPEKISYYKNKLILAEKMQNFSQARMASDELLKLPGLNAEDKEFALSRKAYLAEMTLDFGSALQALSNMKSQEDKTLLKLGMYASLAQKDPKPFYRQYLVKDAKSTDATIVAAMLVRESADPLTEIKKNKSVLAKNPELLAELYLEVYAKNRKPEIAKAIVGDAKLANTAAGKVVQRSELLAEYVLLKTKLNVAKMDASNQKKMSVSLKTRTQLLEQAEKLGAKSIAKADWSAQLLSLDLLAKESKRFYEEILSLPVPEGLSPEDEQTYLTLISQQAAPHKQRADDVERKVSEFWAQNDAIAKLKESYERSDVKLQSFAAEEVRLLQEAAPEAVKTQMAAWSLPQAKVASLTVAEVETARQAVREMPMDKARVKNLLEVEKRMGHQQMVQYLESRLLSMTETSGGNTL